MISQDTITIASDLLSSIGSILSENALENVNEESQTKDIDDEFPEGDRRAGMLCYHLGMLVNAFS